jgi:DNA-binding FadR family transcriptional regulator
MFAGFERAAQNMSVKRHGDIVDAIETGDATKADQTIYLHMDGAAEVLIG